MGLEYINWGITDYQDGWDKQKLLVETLKADRSDGYMVFCQHPAVITLGKNGTFDNILLSKQELSAKNIQVIENNRGGDVTLHNPGQIVGYPIVNLENYKQDLHWFLRTIESSIIKLLKGFGIEAGLYDGFTGVWIEKQRKIAAIGLNCSRWVTSHGFALNVDNDITQFEYIIPCGIEDKQVTSITQELSSLGIKNIDYEQIQQDFYKIFSEMMNLKK